MVEIVPDASPDAHSPVAGARLSPARPLRAIRKLIHRHRISTAAVAIVLLGVGWVLGTGSGDMTARAAAPRSSAAATPKIANAPFHPTTTTTSTAPVVASTTTSTSVVVRAPVTTPPATATPVTATAAPVVAAPSVPSASVAALVSEVEASGIDPGSNWTWSMGDTASHCGVMTGAGTGCTYGSGGLEYTVFSGSPTLALVAHELANAETQNDAVPDLLNQVAAAAGGTTWSATDGVASCLVAHFMGYQDGVAGTWQCPADLAATVASNIHNSL